MNVLKAIAAVTAAVLLVSCEESKYGEWTFVCKQYYSIRSEESRTKILDYIASDSYFGSKHYISGPKDECSRTATEEFFKHTHALGDSLIASTLDTVDYLTIVLDCVAGVDTTDIASTAWASKKAYEL